MHSRPGQKPAALWTNCPARVGEDAPLENGPTASSGSRHFQSIRSVRDERRDLAFRVERKVFVGAMLSLHEGDDLYPVRLTNLLQSYQRNAGTTVRGEIK